MSAKLTGLSSGLTATHTFTDGPAAASLEQVRNGAAGAPNDPGEWVNGNAGSQNSHYAEGMSIPYRTIMTGMPPATVVTLTLEYDVQHSQRLALDYLTSYDRLEPHLLTFGHNKEVIDPTIGVDGISGPPNDYHNIPSPNAGNIYNSPVAGQPETSFANVAGGGQAQMSIWNGDITNIVYVDEAPQEPNLSLSANQSEQIQVTFTTGGNSGAPAQTVILSWGGHIASRQDWGFLNGEPRSAGGISGSPYHMRLIGWNLNNLGNQDRSLSADAVIPPPECELTGLETVCEGTTNDYTVTPINAINPSYSWAFLSNSAGATFVGPTNGNTVSVNAGSAGSYVLEATINSEFGTTTCQIPVTVTDGPDLVATATPEQCDDDNGPSNDGTIDLTVTGNGPFLYSWSNGETTEDLTNLPDGTSYVTVTDANGCIATTLATVEAANPLRVECSATPVTCDDDNGLSNDGTATVDVTSVGAGVASIEWSDGQTGATATGLAAGNYTVTVTDNNGCTASCTATVEAANPLSCSITSFSGLPLCGESTNNQLSANVFGGANGYTYVWSIVAIDAGGTEIGDASPYGWSIAGGQGTGSINFVAGDTYRAKFKLTVTDANGCVTTCETIVQPCSTVSLLKTTCATAPSVFNWTFELYEGPDGFGSTALATGTTSGSSYLIDFDFVNLDPSRTYSICELGVPAGWTTVWQVDTNGDGVADMIIPSYNPNADDPIPSNMGNYCFDFGAGTSYPVILGGTLVFEVDNCYPGGDPRTPGYWKNWSSCSGGNQFANADGCGAGQCTLDEILNSPGIVWNDCNDTNPSWVILTCEQAVNVLDQREQTGSNKKRASDAAYTLAMHLLAAQLNFAAGAESCQAALDAALEAEQLLCTENYTGTGTYLSSKDDRYAHALCLAEVLDSYNNGNLCPDGSLDCVYTPPTGGDGGGGGGGGKKTLQTGEASILVYPNPATSQVTIEFTLPEEGRVTLELFNMIRQRVGRFFDARVDQGAPNFVRIPAGSIGAGQYLYRLSDGARSYHGKIVLLE